MSIRRSYCSRAFSFIWYASGMFCGGFSAFSLGGMLKNISSSAVSCSSGNILCMYSSKRVLWLRLPASSLSKVGREMPICLAKDALVNPISLMHCFSLPAIRMRCSNKSSNCIVGVPPFLYFECGEQLI